MTALLAGLPLQLVCQLIVPEARILGDKNFAMNHQSPPEVQPTTIPFDAASVVRLAPLSLQLVCELLLSSNPVVKEDGTFVDAEIASPIVRASLPEGYVTFPEDHAAYKIHQEYLTWYEAQDQCVSEGGHLAIPDSFDKIVRINSLKRTRRKLLHVGIHQLSGKREWVRIDNGLPVHSVPWAKDSPDSSGKCTGVSTLNHGLVNYPCDRDGEFYVCEIWI